ncbi:hypothetical protein L6452_06537 [Arctium lappa]|uniref:Uncharacterized protein n=1 Tax=Arctium lappa TaxID=4217 RepID=A0ACB9EJ01_ARCLA|nr:hypothetical protein L6452_06537 [Arctium lappa]
MIGKKPPRKPKKRPKIIQNELDDVFPALAIRRCSLPWEDQMFVFHIMGLWYAFSLDGCFLSYSETKRSNPLNLHLIILNLQGKKEYLQNHLTSNPRTYINSRGYTFSKKAVSKFTIFTTHPYLIHGGNLESVSPFHFSLVVRALLNLFIHFTPFRIKKSILDVD